MKFIEKKKICFAKLMYMVPLYDFGRHMNHHEFLIYVMYSI